MSKKRKKIRKKNRRDKIKKKIKKFKKRRKTKPKKRIGISRKIKKKSRKPKKKKIVRITRKTKRIRIKKKRAKKSRKVKRIVSKITLKTKKFTNFNKTINQFKKLSFRKIMGFIFKPLIKSFGDYRQKKKMEKLKKIENAAKEKEKEIKFREKLREELLKKEIKQEEIILRKRESELRIVLKREQKIIRQNQKEKQKKFADALRIRNKLEQYRRRELREIQALEKLSLNYERSEWREVQERIDKIKARYTQLRTDRLKKRVEELTGDTFSDQISIEEIRQKEKEIIQKKQQIVNMLEPFFRSLKTILWHCNTKYLTRNAELIRVDDFREEESEIVIREDTQTENFLMLIYLEDNDPQKSTIYVEDKFHDEHYETRKYMPKDIFRFGDDSIDSIMRYLEKIRKKNKEAS